MRILAIETSCDETAIAVIDIEGTYPTVNINVRADNTLSQIDIHKAYGGVFPMLAKREHARTLVPLLIKTLQDAGIYKKTSRHIIESPLRKEFQEIFEREPELFAQFLVQIPEINPPEIDAIAVTQGPGLEPALWVGINFAKALCLVWKKPIIAVNHMEGHLLIPLLQQLENNKYQLSNIEFPAIGLLISGGHTELILMKAIGDYEIVGETKDDAVGEAFDKVARILGLPYPGGPEISRIGEKGNKSIYPLPRPMMGSNDLFFSFSGLKTAVLYLTKKLGILTEQQKADIAREFENAVTEVLLSKTLRAIQMHGAKSVIIGGGVSANKHLRKQFSQAMGEEHISLYLPTYSQSTDNSLMIALASYFGKQTTATENLKARGNWRIASTS